MKYHTIVADPPWRQERFVDWTTTLRRGGVRTPMPYPMLSVQEIAALPVGDFANTDAHLYLWTTSRYLHDAFDVLDAWGFRYAQVLTWAKTPRGLGPGGAFASTTEFVLFGRRGVLPTQTRINSTWFNWDRQSRHSQKPEAFQDMVERVSPGPYLELFARRRRPGWDVWGNEVESDIELQQAA